MVNLTGDIIARRNELTDLSEATFLSQRLRAVPGVHSAWMHMPKIDRERARRLTRFQRDMQHLPAPPKITFRQVALEMEYWEEKEKWRRECE